MAVAISAQSVDPPVVGRPGALCLVRPAPRPTFARPTFARPGSARWPVAAPAQAQHGRSVYRARRTLALALLLITVMAVAVGVHTLVVGVGGEALTTTLSTGSVDRPGAGAGVYVVQPGDSLWSIVRASGVRGDPRPLVDRLEREMGGRSLQIGQQVVIP
jgi:hypothetical protein